jgi:hypothetical protein
MSNTSNESDILNKIDTIKQNLVIFKNAYRKMSLKSNESFEHAELGLKNEYNYRKEVIKQLEEYKLAIKNGDNNKIILEKEKLSIIFDTYNKFRNDSSLEIANDAILDEYNAHGFLLTCMSDLIGALIELSGDQGESVINEVKLILT